MFTDKLLHTERVPVKLLVKYFRLFHLTTYQAYLVLGHDK